MKEGCEFYTTMTDGNTNEATSICAVALNPLMSLENAKAITGLQSAVESLRNESVKSAQNLGDLYVAVSREQIAAKTIVYKEVN